MNDDLPRNSGDIAGQLSGESLDSYSQHELVERVALLEAEILRVNSHHNRAAQARKLADQLFKPKS